jgi:membrane fusion protein, multidrug efflux system
MKKTISVLAILLLISAPLWLASCNKSSKEKTKEKTKKSAQIAVPVTVMKARMQTVDIQYKSVGTLSSQREPTVRSEISGHVQQILVHEGQQVEQGQTLMVLSKEAETVALNQSQAKLLQAKAVYNERKKALARSTTLTNKGIVSKSKHDQAVANMKVAEANLNVANSNLYNAQYRLAKTDVLSPINGFVQKALVSVGDVVQRGSKLMKLVNHQKLKAHLPFSEDKASKLTVGQKVVLVSPTDKKQQVEARVTSISPAINPINRSIDVVVNIANNQHKWRVGSSIQASVFASRAFKAVVVPEQSLVERPQGLVAFTIEKNHAKLQPVTVGYEANGYAAISKGLKAGDVVVVDGAHYLGNNSLVKIKGNK